MADRKLTAMHKEYGRDYGRYIHCPVCGTRMTDEEISAGMKWAMDGGAEDE